MDWKKQVEEFEDKNPNITKKMDEAIESGNYKIFANKKLFLEYISDLKGAS